jgi:uncharacterized iron-regulated membrane protein
MYKIAGDRAKVVKIVAATKKCQKRRSLFPTAFCYSLLLFSETTFMKLFRKFLFWCHLFVGVITGIVILIMSVTGVLLTYERQISNWADTSSYTIVQPSDGAQRLAVEKLLASVRETSPDTEITGVTMRAAAKAPASISFTGNRTSFVNPYTGEILGEGSKKVRDFFHLVTDWHRWLGAQGENRATARAITGACNLGFFFIVCSGFYLWWPKKWNWQQFKNILWFKRKLPAKARDFNWHNVIGIWSLVPLFFVVLSGVVISYAWAGNLVYKVVGENPPAPRPPAPQSAVGANSTSAPTSLQGLNYLWNRAEQQTSGWQSISLRMPVTEDAPLVFTIDEGDGGQPQKRSQLTIDQKSGEVVRWEPFSSLTTGRRLRSFLRFAHTGEVAGIFGQTIAGLVSAGSVFLVYTGLALSWRRFRKWLARRSEAATFPAPEITKAVAESSLTAE